MNNSLNNTKGIDKSKVLLFLFIANIIPYIYPLIYLIGMSEGNEYIVILSYLYILPIFIPWTLIILLFTSIINTIIDNNISIIDSNVSIKLDTYLSIISLSIQVLAPIILIVFMSSPYLYHFLMLIAFILISLVYYKAYKNNITKQTKNNSTPQY